MAHRQRPDDDPTHAIDLTTIQNLPQIHAGSAELFVLVYHRNGTVAAPLQSTAPVIVGRAPSAAGYRVAADDPSLSKSHARFSLVAGDVFVDDLGSTNGTWMHDGKIKRAQLFPGDMVRLGPAVFAVLRGDAGIAGSLRPIRHERFRCAVEDEILRARHFARPLTLAMFQAEKEGAHVSRFLEAITAHLRPVDRFAFYAPGTVEVLLPEVRGEEAFAWAGKVLSSSSDIRLHAGITAFSKSTADPEKLVAKCRAALRRACPGSPIAWCDPTAPPTLKAGGDDDSEGAVVASPALQTVFALAKRIAPSILSALILGETGVGKEVLARQIHSWSPRSGKPYVAVNCGAIPPSLLESTLFGHAKGAFTDAKVAKPGIFEEAHGGTLLLDEIGELSADAQTRLLRVLEERVVVPIGASRGRSVDVRVIAATHCDLDAMVRKGAFRQDLLYRLNKIVLQIPPLRDRRDEIPPLAHRFLKNEARENGIPVSDIAPAALDCLLSYSWPGNVRELKNTIERAVVLSLGDTLTIDDLPDRVRAATPGLSVPPPPESPRNPGKQLPRSFRVAVTAFEKQLLLEALEACGGDREAAAARLHLPLRTFAYTMRRLGIHLRIPPPPRLATRARRP